MSFKPEHFIEILKALAAKVETVPLAGYVSPGPLKVKDRADFFAVAAPKATKKELDTAPVSLVVITLLKRRDSARLGEGTADNPKILLTFNFYFFRAEGFARTDERNVAPDLFLRKMMASYAEFTSAVFDVWKEFLGQKALAGFPEEMNEAMQILSNPLTQPEFLDEYKECRYVPEEFGHSIDLQSEVEVVIYEQ